MTRAEQEAFETFMVHEYGEDWSEWIGSLSATRKKQAFLAGYRAGFEAQHYEVDDA